MFATIMEPLNDIIVTLQNNWPRLLATLLILVFGWILARLLKIALIKGLRLIKLDSISQKAGIEDFLKKGGMKKDSVEILGSLLYWIALIIILVMVLGIWNIDIGLSRTLVPFLPRIFAALSILILGLFIASLIEDLVRATAANAEIGYAFFLSKMVRWIIVVFVVLTSIQQLKIETTLISTGFLIILASLGFGMALALGLGAKDLVAKKLEIWADNLEKQQKEIQPDSKK